MPSFSWLRAHPRTLASTGAVAAAALTIGTLAVLYDGKPTAEVDLNDGGVWLTKASALMVGHFNKQSDVLDGGLLTTTKSFDLQQSGSRVLVIDQTANSMGIVDPAQVAMGDSAEIPASSTVSLGGDTVAVVDPAGSLWTTPFSAVGGFAAEEDTALANLGDGAQTAVATNGTVYAASPEQAALYAYGKAPDDTMTVTGQRSLPGVEPEHVLSVSAVGNTAYVLDADTDVLYGSDGSQVEVPDGAVLQQVSEEADAVILATPTELVRVPRDGSDIVTVPTDAGEGSAAAPVSVGGCAYGAWSGVGMFVRDCPGADADVVMKIEGVEPTSTLRFRVNREVVVLNDIVGGDAWMASAAMERVDQWDVLTPPQGEGEEEEDSTEETVQSTLPERSEKNTEPTANPDEFGVRPGRTTILPVLDNDGDADGDVLVATVVTDADFGTVEQIYDGGALQITIDDDAAGTTTFSYQVEDGRGGKDTASVTVSVHDASQNSAPVQKRKTTVPVEAGGTAAYNILPDWIDPDGDDIFLQEVAPANGDEADFTSDGQISFRAISGIQGRVEMPIVVSDGHAATNGIAVYDVQPVGSTQPLTAADHVVARVGQTVTVSPLANDTAATDEPLRLARVDDVDGATITPSYADKTFTFTSDIVDTYYVQYLASTGPSSVAGIVRVDVVPKAEEIEDPIAVRDVALLPSGGDVLVNVLGNDSDPNGGVLVVQSVAAEPGSGVTAAVLGHDTVRITDQGGLDRQMRVSYTISNGYASTTGDIIVIPVPAASKVRAPVAVEDRAVVRVGDVVTIPVLDNDYHPNGNAISLSPDLVEVSFDDAAGEIFVSEDTLRFRAGDEAQTVYATYEVVDDQGQRDAALVTIQILPRNDEANAAPRPRDLTARVLSGATVTIPVELNGLDEDGDSVELVGLDTPPSKGRITETGVDTFTYEAYTGATGLDTFTYRVRDALGKEATATVQIGIAPASESNQAPYAVRDSITMRPGRQVAVPVLENDTDPDGDGIGFVDGGVTVPDVEGLAAEVSGSYLLITAPDEEMDTSVSYKIADARGLTSTASVQITVDSSVPLESPIARDDRISSDEITEEATVDIAVLENDDDPDGTRSALSVSLGTGSGNATVRDDGTVRVTLTDQPQLITYTVTDIDDLTASAFLRVPALETVAPALDVSALDAETASVEVISGESIELKLTDYVRTSDGSRVVITEAAKVFAAHDNGDPLIVDQTTLQYTSEEDYFGADALTFEVTDGDGPDDPDGRKATLTIPITVLPPANQQPTMVGAEMIVAPGEDATTLDLTNLATDPDEDDTLRFSLVSSAPDGVSANLDDTTLSVAAAANTGKGTTASLTVEVTDGETDPVQATITVTVTASTRELASANDDVITEAAQGVMLPVEVLKNDVNPFPDTPLKILGVDVEVGSATARVNGDIVEVSPDAQYVGNVVVRYTVEDKTEDVDRRVEGRVRVAVQGRPDMPGKPTVTSVQSRTVVLSWTPPADNGAPITGYTVTSTVGGYSKECASTTCTLDRLTNNVEYNFVVTATNRVGVSDPSVPSETARPDVRPEMPVAPALVFGDESLAVSWTAPKTEGSPVESYTLQISPAPPSGVSEKTGVSSTSIVWDGLENGVPYQVRVRAHNRAPEPSDFSAWSQSMIPARAPDAPAAPTTARLEPVGSQAQIQVTWAAPAANGDAISGYQVQVLQGSTVVNTVPVAAGQTSQAIVVAASETNYTFMVRAQNKAGWGQWSPASSPRRGFTTLGAPTMGTATAGDNKVTVTWTAGTRGGATSGEVSYQYSVDGGTWRSDWVSGGNGSGVIGRGYVNNNGAYKIQVRAVATVDGFTSTSPASAASAQVAPYGKIGNPSAKASASGRTVSYSWSSPTRNGRDITTQVNLNGAGWKTVSASGSGSTTLDYSTKFTIQVRTTAAGQTTSASDSATTGAAPPPPQPRVWVTKGTFAAKGCTNGCYYFKVNTENFPGGNYTVNCKSSMYGTFNDWKGPYSIPSNGSVQLECYHGSDNVDVWVDIIGWGDDVDTEKQYWAK